MKIMLTLLATLLTTSALTSSKLQAVHRTNKYNALTTNDQRHHPVEKFIR